MTAFLLLAPVAGAAGACSFPDVTFGPEPQLEAGAEGGPTDGAGPDVVGLDSGGMPDAAGDAARPPIDATSEKPPIEAGPDGGCIDPCDCDQDGYKSGDASCGEAGGNDCDDLDSRANPDAGLRPDLATPETLGDWNCDRAVTTEYPILGTNCTDRLITSGCGEGLAANVPCGTMGDLYKCKSPGIGLKCVDSVPPVKVLQRCK